MEKNMGKHILWLCALTFVLSSCKTQKTEYNYLRDIEKIAIENSIKNSRSTIQPGDQLVIFVSAKDMEVTAPFNKNYTSSTNVSQYTSPSSNSQPQPVPVSGPTYVVDTDGNINYPVIGLINTRDLTIEALRDELTSYLTKYIKNPTVDVKNINFKVTVSGEVSRPGTYVIPDGNATIWSALGLAGDLTPYGVRQEVLVVRNVNGETTHGKIDLTKSDYMNSPFFHLKQNDYVYVPANEVKQQTARTNPNLGLYISIAGVAVSAIIGVIALTK